MQDLLSRSDRSWLYWSYYVCTAKLKSKLSRAMSPGPLDVWQAWQIPQLLARLFGDYIQGSLVQSPRYPKWLAGFCSYQVAELARILVTLVWMSGSLKQMTLFVASGFFFLAQTKSLSGKTFILSKKPPSHPRCVSFWMPLQLPQ